MATIMFLTNFEIETLTSRRRKPAQIRVLCALGIEHKVRPDGGIIVLRSHVEGLLGGAPESKVQKSTVPDWEAIDHVAKTA